MDPVRSGPIDGEAERSPRERRVERGVFLLLLLATLALGFTPRVRDLSAMFERPETSFSRGVPTSGSDSYHWFRMARALRSTEGLVGECDPLRAWPDGLERGAVPAYPWLIAKAAALSGRDVYTSALVLNVALTCLFVVPLAYHGRALGLPLAGLLGGYVGSLAPAYVQRASAQRVDTDGGTLFFLFLLALALGALRPQTSRRRNLVTAGLAGLTLAAFCRWYGQPGFWLVYAGTAVLHLLLAGFARRDGALLAGVFLLCSNPLSALPGLAGLVHFVEFYVLPSASAVPSPLDYANITRDITELQPQPIAETLSQIVDGPAVAAVGLGGFVLFALLRFRQAIPLLPVALLGFYTLAGPQRFIVFLAPLVGFGLGFLLDEVGRRLSRIGATVAAVVLAIVLLPHGGFSRTATPRIPVRTIASLQALAEKLPPKSAILTSWGSGYLVADVTGAATFTDGEAPDPIVHHLYARALTSDDPQALVRAVAILSTFGQAALHAALDDAPDPGAALDALLARKATTRGDVVLLLSERDLPPFPTFFRTGRWDFERGDGPEDGFVVLACGKQGSHRLRCSNAARADFVVDLENGHVTGTSPLRRIVEIDAAGRVVEAPHAKNGAFTLELLARERPGAYTGYLVSERIFRTTFNQLFLLGRHDPAMLEELHRDLPVLRAYRVRATDGSEANGPAPVHSPAPAAPPAAPSESE